MHRPVVAWRLGELAGAVERVHDPHALRRESPVLVGPALQRLLGEHGVIGPVLGQQAHQEVVGGLVARVLQLATRQPLLTDLDEPPAGGLGKPGGEDVVVGVLRRDTRIEVGHAATFSRSRTRPRLPPTAVPCACRNRRRAHIKDEEICRPRLRGHTPVGTVDRRRA